MKPLLYLLSFCLFVISCNKDEESDSTPFPCSNTPGLSTYQALMVDDNSAKLNGLIAPPSCQTTINSQGFVWSKNTLPEVSDNFKEVSGTNVSTTITGLDADTKYYFRTYLTSNNVVYYGEQKDFKTDTSRPSLPAVYLDSNGITIKAHSWAIIGDTGTVNGVTYTVVNENDLRYRVDNNYMMNKVCVSRVTSMYGLFQGKSPSVDISHWDVSNVENMSLMFSGSPFNGSLNAWDVGKVTTMNGMFAGATAFNQPLDQWNTSSVETFQSMFGGATSFNQDISSWDVSNAEITYGMFFRATSFNQVLNNWNVGKVTDMTSMFEGAIAFNSDLSGWTVSQVTACSGFSDNTPAWTSPKPNFTNCTP